jgi:hypothetical protein
VNKSFDFLQGIKFYIIFFYIPLLLSCNDIGENNTQVKENINWNEVLFGVGVMSSDHDTIESQWYHFPILDNSIAQLYEEETLTDSYFFKNDTIVFFNMGISFMHTEIPNSKLIQHLWEDSIEYILSYTEDSLIKFDLLKGYDSLQLKSSFWVKMYPKKRVEKFQYMNIISSMQKISLKKNSVFSSLEIGIFNKDIFGVLQNHHGLNESKPKIIHFTRRDIGFINSFIAALNDLIEKSKIVYSQDIRFGYFDLKMIQDSTMYHFNYDNNETPIPIEPFLIHGYLLKGVDSSQFKDLPTEYNDKEEYIEKYIKTNMFDSLPKYYEKE